MLQEPQQLAAGAVPSLSCCFSSGAFRLNSSSVDGIATALSGRAARLPALAPHRAPTRPRPCAPCAVRLRTCARALRALPAWAPRRPPACEAGPRVRAPKSARARLWMGCLSGCPSSTPCGHMSAAPAHQRGAVRGRAWTLRERRPAVHPPGVGAPAPRDIGSRRSAGRVGARGEVRARTARSPLRLAPAASTADRLPRTPARCACGLVRVCPLARRWCVSLCMGGWVTLRGPTPATGRKLLQVEAALVVSHLSSRQRREEVAPHQVK